MARNKFLPALFGACLLGTSAAADGVFIGGDASVAGSVGTQTAVAIGRGSARAVAGGVTGDVRIGGDVRVTGRARSQTAVSIASTATAGVGMIDSGVRIGGDAKTHASVGRQTAVGIGFFKKFSYSCVGCITRK